VTPEILVRRAVETDRPAILALASSALGWREDEPNEALFRWKHDESPFGPSPTWVAEVEGRLAGVRVFLRWEFEAGNSGPIRAVRAVDTATHPDFQGRGIFKRLTLTALGELAEEGVGFVFNTPNSQSRPGYLKMGWQDVGRLPVRVLPSSPAALWRMMRARVPAGKWSIETAAGESAVDVLADREVDDLVDSLGPDGGLRTRRTREFLQWRYGLEALHYRVLVAEAGPGDGILVFRRRARGEAVEVVVADVMVRAGDRTLERRLMTRLRKLSLGDYLIRIDRRRRSPGGLVPLPRQGPILTWRSITQAGMPPLEQWDLALGDIELF
jgi:GNAT superfamily N-acetyltransferase